MTGRLPTPTTSLRRFDLFLPLALGQHQLVAQGPPDQVTNYIFALPPKLCQVTPLRQSLTAAACEELLVPGVRLSGRRCIFDEGKSLVKASGPNEGFSQRRTGVRSPPYLDDGGCVPSNGWDQNAPGARISREIGQLFDKQWASRSQEVIRRPLLRRPLNAGRTFLAVVQYVNPGSDPSGNDQGGGDRSHLDRRSLF